MTTSTDPDLSTGWPIDTRAVVMCPKSRMVIFYGQSGWTAANHPSKAEIRLMPMGVQDAVKDFSAETLKIENKAYKAQQKALGF